MHLEFDAEFKFGELIKTDTNFYNYQEVDSIGNLIYSVDKSFEDGIANKFTKKSFLYNSSNYLISKKIIDIIDADSTTISYEYIDHNIKKIIEFLNNKIDLITVFEYNEKNKKVKQKFYDSEKKLFELWSFKYDENGNVISKTKYDSKNNLIELSKFEYDENGSLLSENKYDSNGVLLMQEIKTYSKKRT